jgi:hypothetical protein
MVGIKRAVPSDIRATFDFGISFILRARKGVETMHNSKMNVNKL